jgi:cell division control protein 6
MIFQNKEMLEESYIPNIDEFLVRKEANDVQIVLNNFTTGQSNLLIYGFSGSGKTCTVQSLIKEKRKTLNPSEKIVYLNMNNTFSELDAISGILNEIGIMATSKSRFKYYNILKQHIRVFDLKILIVLDEIDKLLEHKGGNSLLVNLLESEKSRISIIAITNNPMLWEEQIELSTKNRFGMKKSLFKPYNMGELNEILNKRTEKAFYSDSLEENIIGRLSVMCIQQNIDLRQAFKILKISGEIAEEKGTKIKEEYIENSVQKTERLAEKEIISSLPAQSNFILQAMLKLAKQGKIEFRIKEIYEKYCELSEKYQLRVLSQNRMFDFLWSMEKLGIITSRRLSRAKGTERIFTFKMPADLIAKIMIENVEKYKSK